MTDAWASLARARNLIQLQRYDAALEALVPALGDSEAQAEAWCLRTQALLGKGDLKQALPAARRALALDPHDEWPHRLLALVLQNKGKSKDALRAAREAARLAPHQAETLHVLATCQVNARKKAAAQATADTLLDLHPHLALAHQTAGLVAMSRGDWASAEFSLREALQLDPHDAEVPAALAEVLKKAGRRQEAGQMLLAAARANPTDHGLRRSLGRLGLPVTAVAAVAYHVLAPMAFPVLQHVRPGTVAVILALLFALVGGYLSLARLSGTRALPREVHEGLMPDHLNYALTWLAGAALASLLLAVWAAAAPQGHGRSMGLCLGLILFAAVALATVLKFWTGPLPFRLPGMPAWLRRRRNPRGKQ